MSIIYRNGQLAASGVPLAVIAREVGTAFYVYDLDEIERRFQAFAAAFPGALIAYAYKANSSLALCTFLARLGAGADVVSGGELFIAQRAGVPGEKTVFNGTGKTDEELRFALESWVRLINVDSAAECERLAQIAQEKGLRARIAFRVNPDVDAQTHPHIATGLRTNKFGVPIDEARGLYRQAMRMPGIEPVGVHCHIGSQITSLAPMVEATLSIAALVRDLQAEGIPIRYIDIGGGLGISYQGQPVPTPADWAAAIRPILADLDCQIILEPGRSIVAPAGALVAQVLYVKKAPEKTFVVIDAGMNALMRPALYNAYHEIVPLVEAPGQRIVDVVGPICESADVLGRDRALPAVKAGDLLAVLDAGAYGFALSNTYNAQPRPTEVVVRGDRWWTVRRRETWEEMLAGEVVPDEIRET